MTQSTQEFDKITRYTVQQHCLADDQCVIYKDRTIMTFCEQWSMLQFHH